MSPPLGFIPSNRLNLIGQKFGRLTAIKVIGRSRQGKGANLWECLCRCGKETITETGKLINGSTKSCGCFRKEITGKTKRKHGMSSERFYNIWCGILKRCNNNKSYNYAYYGGRGIKCEWKSFLDFKKNMHKTYIQHENKYGSKDTTIDRINVNGNYCKENCRWATRKEQSRNQRSKINKEQ